MKEELVTSNITWNMLLLIYFGHYLSLLNIQCLKAFKSRLEMDKFVRKTEPFKNRIP